jgi:hypothetical protein
MEFEPTLLMVGALVLPWTFCSAEVAGKAMRKSLGIALLAVLGIAVTGLATSFYFGFAPLIVVAVVVFDLALLFGTGAFLSLILRGCWHILLPSPGTKPIAVVRKLVP